MIIREDEETVADNIEVITAVRVRELLQLRFKESTTSRPAVYTVPSGRGIVNVEHHVQSRYLRRDWLTGHYT
jgi:hypothetical protein